MITSIIKGANKRKPTPFNTYYPKLTSRKVSTIDSRLILLVSSSSHLKDKICRQSVNYGEKLFWFFSPPKITSLLIAVG